MRASGPIAFPSRPGPQVRRGVKGFTLLEVLVAVAIYAGVFAMISSIFWVTQKAWVRGSQMMEELHHGDFVMEQLVSALRSMAYFKTAPDKYGFRMEDKTYAGYPGDAMSWVTSGTAFMPVGSHLVNGLHRIEISIDDNEDGEASVAIRAYPHLAEEDDVDVDPWFVSSVVKGIDCRVYNVEDEVWEDEWEDTNSVPSLLEITLYMEPVEEYGDPVTVKRLVEIPIAPMTNQSVSFSAPSEAAAEEGGRSTSATRMERSEDGGR